jgi:DNA-binding MurR/RpiR family transcriptional regulator
LPLLEALKATCLAGALFTNYIVNANKKIIIGNRNSFSLVHFLSFKIKKILPKVQLVNNLSETSFDCFLELDLNDVLIVISFPRYAKLTLKFCEYAKNNRLKVLVITDNKTSPLYKLADACLFCPYEGVIFHNSNVAAFALLNIIIGELFKANYEKALNSLKKEEAITEYFDIIHLKKINREYKIRGDIFD